MDADGRLGLGIGLAFGHTDADAFESLIEAAQRAGALGLRTAPGRALVIIGVTAETAPTLAEGAESLGFITRLTIHAAMWWPAPARRFAPRQKFPRARSRL